MKLFFWGGMKSSLWVCVLLLGWRGLCLVCWGCWFQMQVDRWWDDLAVSLLNQSVTAFPTEHSFGLAPQKLFQLPAQMLTWLSFPFIFIFFHFHFHLLLSLSLSPSLLKQKMSTGGNSWTSAGREETRSAAAGPLSDCRADQSKWVSRAPQPIATRKRGLPAKLAQLEAKEGYTFMTFISSVCQHTMKGSQRCITATRAVHASLT